MHFTCKKTSPPAIKKTDSLSTCRHLSSIVSNGCANFLIIEESAWLLLMTWHQQIYNHHDDVGRSVHMMTSSKENFSALLSLCPRNSPITGEFSSQRPVTRSFDVFFDLRLNKRFSKQNREAGDSRWHHAHYDVVVMISGPNAGVA